MLPLYGYLFLSFAVFTAQAQHFAPRVLIYSATAAFRHDSIPTAIAALKANSASINVTFDDTEDRTDFNDINLANYDGVVFLSNTGEVLDESGKTALQNYLNNGGNFIGIHSASDSLRNTTFFVRQIGARFDYHADLQEATVNVIGPTHPSTSEVPEAWTLRDEMYNFDADPRDLGSVVILSADESSYTDNGPRRYDQGSPHPLAWYQERGAGVDASGIAGRSFYTSLGHLNETWQDATFLSHVLGGISWALQSNTTRAFNSSGLVGNPEPREEVISSGTASTGNANPTPGSTSTGL
ncbi:hypothetical protein H1R20_g14231, partial [Candolleomyces eurysporus]